MYSRRPAYDVVAPVPESALEALDLAYLADVHRRWSRCLAACSGNRAHALNVWRDVLRAELRAAREEAEHVQQAIDGWRAA